MLCRLCRNFLLALCTAALLSAQSETATLRGTVRGPARERLANITVIILDAAANTAVRQLTTGNSGMFAAPYLKPGLYRITIEEEGFLTLEADGIRLDPGESRQLDLTLVARTAETAAAAPGESPKTHVPVPPSPPDSGTLGSPVDYQARWNDTPQVDRHPSVFPLLVTAPSVQGNGRGLVISGISSRDQQTWALDGLPQDTTTQTANPAFLAVTEVTIANPGVDASRPVSFNMVSKRGGETLHGMLYYKRGTSRLDARSFFDTVKPSYKISEAAGELSGSLIPEWTHFYAGGMYQKNPYVETLYADVPTDQMRQRDLSQYLSAQTAPNGKVVVVNDPRTGSAFVNNQIPANRVSSVASQYLTYYPAANAGGANKFTQNYSWQHLHGPDTYIGNWPFGRIDQKIASSNQLYVRWMQSQTASVAAGSVGNQLASTQSVRYRNLVVSDVQAFSSGVVNELRAGRTGIRVKQGENEGDIGPMHGDSAVTTLGLQGVNPLAYSVMGFPAVSIRGLTPLSMKYGGGYSNDVAQNDRILSLEDSLTWSHGRHALRMGAQYQHFNWTLGAVPQTLYGSFDFTGEFTGLAFADFLLGLPATSTRQNVKPNRPVRQKQFGLFLSDSFRVHPRLTLDYGVRWDYYGTPVYKDGYMANWDPASGNVVVAPGTITSVNGFYPKSIPIAIGQVVPKANMTNVRPRVGVAYRLSDNLVLRGGYGEFTESRGYGASGTLNPTDPWYLVETYTNSISRGVTALSFPKPFPTSNSPLLAGQSVTAFPARNEEGVIRQYHATLERATHGLALRASYIGSRGVGMNYILDINKPRAHTTPFAITAKPYPQFASTYVTRTDGAWHYDSLVLETRKRTGPVTFDTSFTWGNNFSNYANTTDPYHVTDKWTRDSNDRRLYFVGRALWAIPAGKGRRFLSQAGPLVNRVVNGWTLQAITTFASGQYYSPWFTGPDPANASQGYVTQLPDCVGDPNAGARTLDRWFNPSAFAIPPANAGRYGTCGMNVLEGYPIHVGHLSVSKRISLGEQARFVFTARVSNFTNTPHFTIPNSNISNPNPGMFTASSLADAASPEKLGPRQFDFKLRLEW